MFQRPGRDLRKVAGHKQPVTVCGALDDVDRIVGIRVPVRAGTVVRYQGTVGNLQCSHVVAGNAVDRREFAARIESREIRRQRQRVDTIIADRRP